MFSCLTSSALININLLHFCEHVLLLLLLLLLRRRRLLRRALRIFDAVVSVHEDIERHGRHGMSAAEQCVDPSALKRCMLRSQDLSMVGTRMPCGNGWSVCGRQHGWDMDALRERMECIHFKFSSLPVLSAAVPVSIVSNSAT